MFYHRMNVRTKKRFIETSIIKCNFQAPFQPVVFLIDVSFCDPRGHAGVHRGLLFKLIFTFIQDFVSFQETDRKKTDYLNFSLVMLSN